MKSGTISSARVLALATITTTAVILVAWRQQEPAKPVPPVITQTAGQDTVPVKNDGQRYKKIRDLDEAIEELDKAQLDINMDKLQAELDKIKPQMEQEMANAKREMEKAIREIDVAKIKADVEASVAKIDWEQMKTQIEKVKEMDFDKMNANMEKLSDQLEKLKPSLEKNLQNARRQIEKAKTEMKEYKTFVDGLENDGLINKKEGYTIRHADGELSINGKKQPADVYEKYRSFLEKHKTMTIKKSKDDFTIDND
ncbi:MAG TPA: hypothetical protein VFS36_04340 [Chitinophagaceae bacterium]|jgi:hypothetical protein|nr:hypothetical protein [Chitinophagaceae bacterium]